MNAKPDPSCSADPSQVALGETYVVTAADLPAGSPVSLVRELPDGATMKESWLDIPHDGSFVLSQTGGFWNGETGIYVYRFVGKITWPEGTWSKEYCSCTVTVA